MRFLRLGFFVCCLSALFVSFAFAQKAALWKLLSPPGALFAVKLPGTPQSQNQTINDPTAGKLDMKMYVLSGTTNFYAVEDMKAEKRVAPSEYVATLEGVQHGFLSTSGTTLVSAQQTTFKGYVARTMMFKKDSKLVRGLSLMVDNHCLCFFAMGEGSQIKSPAITNFFDSIKIKGK